MGCFSESKTREPKNGRSAERKKCMEPSEALITQTVGNSQVSPFSQERHALFSRQAGSPLRPSLSGQPPYERLNPSIRRHSIHPEMSRRGGDDDSRHERRHYNNHHSCRRYRKERSHSIRYKCCHHRHYHNEKKELPVIHIHNKIPKQSDTTTSSHSLCRHPLNCNFDRFPSWSYPNPDSTCSPHQCAACSAHQCSACSAHQYPSCSHQCAPCSPQHFSPCSPHQYPSCSPCPHCSSNPLPHFNPYYPIGSYPSLAGVVPNPAPFMAPPLRLQNPPIPLPSAFPPTRQQPIYLQ